MPSERTRKIRIGFFCEKGIGRSWAFHEALRSLITNSRLQTSILSDDLRDRLTRLNVFGKLRSFHAGVTNYDPQTQQYSLGRNAFFNISKSGIQNKTLGFLDFVVPVAEEAEKHFEEKLKEIPEAKRPVLIVPSEKRVSNLYQAVGFVLEKIADELERRNKD